MKLIVGLAGRKGVGKTSAGMFLERHGFVRFSFAERLKILSKQMFEFTENDLNGTGKEKKFRSYEWTPREFMEKYGEFMRYWDTNYWLGSLMNRIVFGKETKIVIDDIRYPNEADGIRKLDGVLIQILRYEHQNPYKLDTESVSENSLNNYKFDFVVPEHRNGTLGELYSSVFDIVKPYIKK